MSQALIITGMHRSGTSLVAELLRMAGVHVGDNLLAADPENPRGYFEDHDFLTLQREMVAAACPKDAAGWADWGWTEQEILDDAPWTRFEGRAQALAEARAADYPVWGWKDPRTSLLLDFWLRMLPKARFLFVVREPWAVADSVRRLPLELFRTADDVPVRIWSFYNRRLLAFYQAHPDRCIVLPIGSLHKNPHKTLDRITERFGLAFLTNDRTDCAAVVHAALARAHAHDRHAQKQFMADYPAAADLWLHLLDAAASPWSATPPAAVVAPIEIKAAPPLPPRLSIVIPCYNDGRFLLEAIESIEACKDGLHETLIVDDGSTDPATLEIFASLEQRGYKILHKPHEGLCAACNHGVRAAAGEFIMPLGADNRIHPAYITRGIEVLDSAPEVGVVYGDPQLFGDETGHQVLPDFDAQRLHVTNYIDACAVYRKKVWEDVGGYDESLPVPGYEDWDLWLGAAQKGWMFHHLPEVLFDYRVRADSLRTHYLDPEKNSTIVRYIAAKHPYFAEHYADIIGDLHALYVSKANACKTIASESAGKHAAELEQARADLAAARERIAQLEKSLSWRVTSPLRAARDLVGGTGGKKST